MSNDTVWLTGTSNGQQVVKERLINVPAPLDFALRLAQKLKGADAIADLKVTGGPFSITGSVEGIELPAFEIPAADLNWEWSITLEPEQAASA